MPDLSLHPVYLSARAAVIAPEKAIPVTLYAAQKWLPRLGPERWCLILLLRSLCMDAPRRNDGTKRVTSSWRELAEMLNVHEETVASWLKHKPIPNDKPWRRIIPVDDKAEYLALFIPRLRYAYETHKGKTRRVGFLLEILMEDPVVPEDEARLEQTVEMLRMQQGELGLETYRLAEQVNREETDLHQISRPQHNQGEADSPYVNQIKAGSPAEANPALSSLHNQGVNPDSSDLLSGVKHNNPNSASYVNQPKAGLPWPESEESGKNVNELNILIQQLKQKNIRKNLRRSLFEPVIQLTETLLEDTHSSAMLFKVLSILYPERLDLYLAATRVALEAAEEDPLVNRGAVFVRALRDFADAAGVDLGLRRASDDPDREREDRDESMGTRVPIPKRPATSPLLVDEQEAIWAETQSALRRQMTRATYETIIQGTVLLRQEGNHYLVGVQSKMAKDWLENRLHDIVRRTLSSVVGSPVAVEFTMLDVSG